VSLRSDLRTCLLSSDYRYGVPAIDRYGGNVMTAVPDWGVPGRTDAELAVAAAAGDRGAFAGIYDRYADRLHDFCVGMLRDRDAAADCVQDVFCTAATTLNQLREPDKLRPWLYAIARNEALRRIRARRREQPTDELPDAASADAGPDTLAARSELANLIAEAAGGLSDRDRTVLELGYRHGLEGPDLAEALGVSPATANKMVHRLRDTMQRSLGALLVARRGRTTGNSCAELGAILAGWDGTFTILMRKRIARHIESCPICEQDRRRLVNPVALLGGAPVFIPAPAWLREHTLHQVQLTSASTTMGGNTEAAAPTQARPSLAGAATERWSIPAVPGDYDIDADGDVAHQSGGRVLLFMALLIGIPLIALGVAMAWRYQPNTAVTPIGGTGTTAPAPTSHTPTGPPTPNNPPPPPPAPSAVATVPTTGRAAPSSPPATHQPQPTFRPAAPSTTYQPPPLPPRHWRPIITDEPPPPIFTDEPPPLIVTDPPPPPITTDPLPPSGRQPPVTQGPITPAPVTTTTPVIR
jgi:RNA polymerase sigma factor (sigma-70 family)